MARTRRRGGWLGTLLYRLIILVLSAAILVVGYQLTESVLRRVSEQTEAEARRTANASTATVLAAAQSVTSLMPLAPVPTEVNPVVIAQLATLTPTVSIPDSPSPVPSMTLEPTASATVLPTLTPPPTQTMTSTAVPPTATDAALAQVFFTNTPRPMSFVDVTLPPLNTLVPSQTPIASSTPFPTPSATPTVAVVPTLPDVTATPRPLPTLWVYSAPPPDAAAPTAIPTAVEWVDRQGYDLMNILLLGNDEELSDDNFIRTDTMIIVSINRTTGTVSMLGLPRDMFVYIPDWTMQRLNLAYERGTSVGWSDGGFGLLRQTILYNFGINVHYYAMVNLTGLKALIDTVGGIEVAVDCAILNLPLIGAEVPQAAARVTDEGSYLLPVGMYEMNGAEALWYARARDNAIEFDRQRRQMQLLRAIWRKARDTGLLTNAPALWNEIQPYIETNLTFEDLIGLLPLALSLDPGDIENFTFRRLYHTTPWQTPDGASVQLPVADTVRELMEAFYSPPTTSQLRSEAASIRVLNGTTHPDWDRVAADRLGYSGYAAAAAGPADRSDYSETVLVDYTGMSKGSSLQDISQILNVSPAHIRVSPNPGRDVDFEVILGDDYSSCAEGTQLTASVEGG